MVFARRPGARGRCINHDRVGLTGASHTPAKRHVGEDEDVGRWARRPAHPRTDTDARTHTRAGSSMTSGPGCACERVRGLHILICAATAVDTSSRSANLAKLQRARSCETMPRLPLARCSLDPFFPAPERTTCTPEFRTTPAQASACPPHAMLARAWAAAGSGKCTFFACRNLSTGTHAPEATLHRWGGGAAGAKASARFSLGTAGWCPWPDDGSLAETHGRAKKCNHVFR